MDYKLVRDCQDIDIGHHAIIEASAGTGKTYTIENLVVRLLKERQDIELDRILLVTFTEKATSELKLRIREKLEAERRLPENREIAGKIKNTLDAFDTASIFTIHSFCQSILRDFAFENRMPFQSEVINDKELHKPLLKDVMRKHWPSAYGEELTEILEASDFARKKQRFEDVILDIVQKYRENAGDILMPELKGKSFQEAKEEVGRATFELKSLIGPDKSFSTGFECLNINARARKNILENIVLPIETYVCRLDDESFDFSDLADLMTQIQGTSSSGKKGSQCLVPEKWLKKGPNPEVCPNLEKIAGTLGNIASLLAGLEHFLSIETVRQLQAEAARVKRKNGQISFDDMLNLVWEALSRDNAAALLGRLREKYKIAFVDEFQDTDPVQWRIFRKMFLDAEEGNLLFLIGDPKQAIYAFRGADVYAYLDARREMEALAEKGQAKLYSLGENWRSEPELIQGFNRLFPCPGWFKSPDEAGPFDISYQPVSYPAEKEKSGRFADDRSGRPVLNIIDLSDAEKASGAKKLLAAFVAREIRHLTRSIPDLGFGDICILVRGKSEVPIVEKALAEQRIPCSYYKKPRLFLSDEALYLSFMFRAILNPGHISEVKKALLTPFFAFSPEDLSAYELLPPFHPVRQLFSQWEEYAKQRKWSLLFQSLTEETGLVFRESEKADWDRTYTNYRQIFEHLEDVAYRKNLDFRGVSALLDGYVKESVFAGEDADIHQIESDEKKVQIMTMHVSKGLEFPVVFIAGGLTRGRGGSDYRIYHDPDEKNGASGKIIDLSKQSGEEASKREAAEEDKRLYYVALTRARHKLYLPHKTKERGSGPASILLAPAIENAFPRERESKDVIWLGPDMIPDNSEDAKPDREADMLSDDSGEASPLFPPEKSYTDRIIRLESFSSLHRRNVQAHEEDGTYGFRIVQEGNGKADDAPESPEPAQEKDEEMPGGAAVGSMFHAILENIDFEAVKEGDAELREEASKQMEIFRVDERWKDEVCRMVLNTLTTPIPHVADGFCLADLKKEDRLHETEFYCPFAPEPEEERGTQTKQYLRGWIDLIFRHDGKYYIADWKSNRVEAGYHRDALWESMEQEEYHLQYKIYAIALLRRLAQGTEGTSAPESRLGGVFYFYLRGMGKGEEGICHVSPEELGNLEQLEKEIREGFGL